MAKRAGMAARRPNACQVVRAILEPPTATVREPSLHAGPAARKFVQEPNSDAGRAVLGQVRGDVALAFGVGGAGDVQVDPRPIGDEMFEECRGGDRAAMPPGRVLDVRDRALDVLAVLAQD